MLRRAEKERSRIRLYDGTVDARQRDEYKCQYLEYIYNVFHVDKCSSYDTVFKDFTE